jgi:D-sedoheptulose 7-phosphate isomerase
VSHLSQRYNFARPSLPAVLLQFDGVVAAVAAENNELDFLYRRQLQTVAQEGDLLIAFMPTGREQAVRNVMQTANSENLDIIVFSGQNDEQTQSLLDEQDLEISVPSDNEMRLVEVHLFCLNLLCELIDVALFSTPSLNN